MIRRFSKAGIFSRLGVSRPSLMASREKIQEGSLERCIVLRFHHYIDKHSLSSLGAFREAPGENKQYAFAVLARISLELLSACARVRVYSRAREALSRPYDQSGRRYCVSTSCLRERARARARTCVCGHNRLFRVDLCGALRQNVRCDPA